MIYKFGQLLLLLILFFACSIGNHELRETKVLDLTEDFDGELILYEIGTIETGDQAILRLQLRNAMKHPVIIQEVRRFCGCTKAEFDSLPIMAEKTSVIKVEFVADQPGIFSKSVKIFLNSQKQPIELKLRGEAIQSSARANKSAY